MTARKMTLLLSALTCVMIHGSSLDAVENSAPATSPACDVGSLSRPLSDDSLEEYRRELLEMAFKAGSAIPVEADLTDRSASQHAAVEACLELGQAARALEYTQQIQDWRRGAAYADLAIHCARHSRGDQARHYISLAEEIAETARDRHRDRIRMKIAQAHSWLGEDRQADRLRSLIEAEAEEGRLTQARSAQTDEDSFDTRMQELEALIGTNRLGPVNKALASYQRLYDLFYEDPERRPQIEQKLRDTIARMRQHSRIEALMALAETALKHQDRQKALELTREAQQIMEATPWYMQDRILLKARLASLRFRAAEQEGARSEVDAALELFYAEHDKMLSHEWVETIRIIAEELQKMGQTPAALAVYRKAVEETFEHPSGRRRALDLSANCRSMALHRMEPDAELWARIRKMHEGLCSPW